MVKTISLLSCVGPVFLSASLDHPVLLGDYKIFGYFCMLDVLHICVYFPK